MLSHCCLLDARSTALGRLSAETNGERRGEVAVDETKTATPEARDQNREAGTNGVNKEEKEHQRSRM